MREFPVIAIRSVEFGVPDVARAEAFYTEVWGLSVAARQGGTVFLRATGADHHALALRAHSSAEILSISFRVRDEDSLAHIARTVEEAWSELEGAIGMRSTASRQ